MAEAVVHDFESIEVNGENRNERAASPLSLSQGVRDSVEYQRPVGQSCEGVVERVVMQLFFQRLEIGYVCLRSRHSGRPAGSSPNGRAPREHPPVGPILVK